MFKKTIIIITLLFFTSISAASAAQLYKWKDEKGSWHFSDTPPLKHETVKDLETEKYTPAKDTTLAQEYSRAYQQTRTDRYIAQQTLKHKLKKIDRKYERNIERIEDEYYDRRKANLEANIDRHKSRLTRPSSRSWNSYNQTEKQRYEEQLKILKKYHK